MYKHYFKLLLVLLVFLGCKGQQGMEGKEDNMAGMELLLRDNYGGMESETHFFIKDQQALQGFYAKINRTRKPGLPLPRLDFSKEMLLVYCAGIQKQGSQELQFMHETKDHYVFKRVKTDTSLEKTAITSPFYIYKMPLSSKKVTIE